MLLDALMDFIDGDRSTIVLLPDLLDSPHDLRLRILVLLVSASVSLVAFLACEGHEGAERVVHELEGLVDVIHCHFVAEVQLGHGLGDSNDAEEHARRHIHVAMVRLVLALELSFLHVLGHDVVVERCGDGWPERLRVGDERTHHIRVNGLVVDLLTAGGNPVLVDRGDVLCELFVLRLVSLVEQKEDHVEAGEEGLGQVDVQVGPLRLVVAAIHRVGSGQDRRTSVETCSDACFGDRNCLLLHDLVNVGAVALIHLVKLINTANAAVGKHQSARL